jgi:hypothetical protein
VNARRRLTLASLSAILAAVLGFCVASCGPSFQIVYEGDVRFEHCYAVDESATTAMKDKAECWRDWMKNYTYGQTRDRIEYAASRQYALNAAPMNPSDEALMEAAPGGGVRKNVISAPMPSSANAPPPATMDPEKADAGAAPKPTAPVQARAPGSECVDGCSKEWVACKDGCTGKACDLCDASYKSCARVCFGDKPPINVPKKTSPPPAAPKSSAR